MNVVAFLSSLLMLLGSLCVLLAAVGIVRMPDLFTRLQAASKASTLGAILILAAVAVQFAEVALAARVLVVIVFLALTTPLGAHLIARAAYLRGSRMLDAGAVDELADDVDALAGAQGSRQSDVGSVPPAVQPRPDRIP
jgi:multicomponent Na+:H+ antiporter subunit G